MTPPLERLPPVDVLVLGAGLAGLAAARAALTACPGAAVVVATPEDGPSGSSFANRNDRLGLHAPDGDVERQDFCREVLDLGRPGLVHEPLVKILAQEALEHRRDLEDLGVPFLRDEHGRLRLFSSCFSPHSRRAAMLQDLAAVHRILVGQVTRRGGRLNPGLTAVTLLQEQPGSRVLGALFEDAAGRLYVRPARAVVAAMGGPASLFAHNQAGRGGTGTGHGLLAEAGASLANTGYLQWMWATLPDKVFWPVWSLRDDAVQALDRQGRPVVLPEAVRQASSGRFAHCPLGYGLADAALDRFLLGLADDLGVTRVLARPPQAPETRLTVALMAHAGNGGARIDARGRTTVPGLFAAGECATGMHGANRLGGAMVAACLVFGSRAGQAAATDPAPDPADVAEPVARSVHGYARDPFQRQATRQFLAHLLQRQGPPREDRQGPDPLDSLAERLRTTADTLAVRMLGTARAFFQGAD